MAVEANSTLAPLTQTAELVLIRTMGQAVASTFGPKKADRFLRAWMENLRQEEDYAKIIPIRGRAPMREEAAVDAASWFKRVLPVLVRRVG
ncbi:MAG: hypothetical protein V4820_11575 [Pseudomonadota bacterium]